MGNRQELGEERPRSLRVLGWAALLLGLTVPLRLLATYLQIWSQVSVALYPWLLLRAALDLVLGFFSAWAGWALLKARPGAPAVAATTAGALLVDASYRLVTEVDTLCGLITLGILEGRASLSAWALRGGSCTSGRS